VAAARHDAIALSSADGQLSYRELAVASNRLARHLRRLGAQPGDRVCLFLERSPAMVVAILAVLAAGAAYVPLDPTYPDERLRFLLTDSGARLVVAADAAAARLAAVLPDGVRLVRADGGEVERESGTPLAPLAGPGDLAYLIYTSGSTGRPKGVGVTHGNVLRLFDATAGWFGFGPEDVWTLFHSYAFDFSVWELWGALAHGGRLVIVPWLVSRSPRLFHELLIDEQVTVLNQTPSAFSQLAREDEAASARGAVGLAPLRLVIFGGEALELQSLAPWFARHGDARPRLVNMFGITETTVHVTYRPLGRGDLGAGSRIGRPIPDLSLYLLDAALEPVALGAAGEIFVGGAGVAAGYLGRPELTAARFLPDPWSRRPGARLYRSGDLARHRPSGDLEIVGRIDHQVKVRGFRIEVGEIEAALADEAGVARALVRGVDDGAGGTRLVAYVVPRAGHQLEPRGLRRALERRLPPYMVPAAYAVIAELPLTVHGKVDLAALPIPQGGPSRRDPQDGRPLTPVEEEVAATWAEVLEREPPGADDNFFDLGGHSLLATQVISRLTESFGCDLPLAMLFERPTVALLGAGIEELLGAGAGLRLPPITPAPRHRPLPLSFAQQRLWILDRWEPGSPTYHVPIALRFAGALDVAALGRALTALVARHEALRTSFPLREGAPVQWVAAPADQRPARVDLGALAAPARERETERLVR
ncbi:MAG TPA: amino acid adenylation domain-containing protein, partial [Thermoanaerobaculia bacterium]